jgi:fatty acid desaturase
MEAHPTAPTPTHWREALSAQEIRELAEASDGRGWWMIAFNWAVVFGAMTMVALSSGWLLAVTIPLAIALIGARQLGFAVVMHDAAHYAVFKTRWLNDWAGNWLGAYPVWADIAPYRKYHLQHHAKNWTKDDPDLDLAIKFPVTSASMKRKIWRDLSGQVGWKRAKAILKRDLAGVAGKTKRDTSVAFGKNADGGNAGWQNLRGVVITNVALLALLSVAGHPALYLLWVAAWFTTNSLVTRIRSIAEHSMVPDPTDPMRNTRTTLASPLERLFIAPNYVNYHLEHHLLMTVPGYKLPRLHQMLRDRGALEGALVANGYAGILRQAASKEAQAAA